MTKIYGIKNCDTMKKAFKWLDNNNIEYKFHDYKKQGVDNVILEQAINEHGWEVVINKRGTTWRNLPQTVKDTMNSEKALNIADDNPSVIKRPLLLHEQKTYIGFNEQTYADILKA